MRNRSACQHQFVDDRSGNAVLPMVNVLATPGESSAMTVGRKYRCLACQRIIDLRVRGYLALPEAPLDTRPIDPFANWRRTGPETSDEREPTERGRREPVTSRPRAAA